MSATARRLTTSELPPNEMNGSGTPVTGHDETTPMFTNAWIAIIAPQPIPGKSKAIRRRQRDLHGAIGQGQKERDDDERSDQAELFSEDREYEIGVLFGQIEELCARGAQADAEDPAAAQRQQRLDDVKAGVQRIAPWIDEGEDSRAPVGTCEHGQRRERYRRERNRREVHQARASREQHCEGRKEERLAVPISGSLSARTVTIAIGTQSGKRPRESEVMRSPRTKSTLKKDHQSQLGELRRLQAQSGGSQPAPTAVYSNADVRNEDEEKAWIAATNRYGAAARRR